MSHPSLRERFKILQNEMIERRIKDIPFKSFTHVKPNNILVEAQEKVSYRVKDENDIRFYVDKDDGNKFAISMTSLIAKYVKNKTLKQWKKRIGEEEATKVAQKAADNGKIHHSLCELYLKNEEPAKLKQFFVKSPLFYIEQFEKVVPELHKVDNILAIEQALFSKKWLVAGTADIIAEYNKKLSIIDHKTSSKEKPKEYVHNYFLQETGYCMIFEEMTGISINQIVTIISVFEENIERGVQVFVENPNNYKDEVLALFKKWEIDRVKNKN